MNDRTEAGSGLDSQVVVTGIGLLTGLGLDAPSTWQGLLQGKSPAKRFTLFDPTGLDSVFGVELPAESEALFSEHLKPRSREQMTRGTMISVCAATLALADSRLDLQRVDRTRVGAIAGATGTGYAGTSSAGGFDEHRILRNMASASGAWIALRHKLLGPSMVVSTACSSGPYALHVAHGLIESGECDVVVAGAGDSALNAADVRGFGSLMALAEDKESFEKACRPFDAKRSGFVMGEGAGMLVLESARHARSREARIYARMHKPGLASEGYNILSPEPGGKGMVRAMRAALAHAKLRPENIDYLNAHGTSTRLNDLYETQAIKELFGSHAKSLAISSTKAGTGHCLAAAGGVEAAIAVLALVHGVVPPTVNLTEPDPELDLDYVPGKPRAKALTHVMSNSFAFGGQNGVCVFSKYS